MKDLANEMVTTLILIKKFDGLTDDAPPKVKPVDTTGTGDCFVGWLGVGIAEGLNLEDAVRRATLAASLATTRPGAQDGMPYRSEVLGS